MTAREYTTMQGAWLLGARFVWAAAVALVLVLWTVGSITLAREPLPECVEVACDPIDFSAADVELAQELDLPSGPFRPPFSASIAIITGVVFFALATLIFWRRSNDRMGLLVAFVLFFLGGVFFTSADEAAIRAHEWLTPAVGVVKLIGMTALISLFFLFPDGRFAPSWTRWGLLVFGGAALISESAALGSSSVDWTTPPLIAFGVVIGVAAQVYRYRRVSEATQRQQTKWVVVGLIGTILLMLVWSVVAAGFPPEEPSNARVYALLIAEPVILLLLFLLPISLAVSILRYRLWEIDVILNRTLVYGTLTATLAGVYVGSVVGLQAAFRGVTGQSSDLAIVISTLAIAALFVPLRAGIQRTIDRRLYRRKYDAARTLAAFTASMRDVVDVDKLTGELVAIVEGTMQPAHTSLWLREGHRNASRNDTGTIVP